MLSIGLQHERYGHASFHTVESSNVAREVFLAHVLHTPPPTRYAPCCSAYRREMGKHKVWRIGVTVSLPYSLYE